MEPKHVLIVDDEFISELIIKRYLDLQGSFQYTSMTNGKEALDFIQECQKNNSFPDYILLDLRMPVMDGFEFLDKCSGTVNFPNELKIVVITSSIYPDDFKKAGSYPTVSGFIQKPIKPHLLREIFV